MNDDGRLDLAEYMKAVFGEGASEVEWKDGEEQFGKDRDLDQDGFMDKEEVRSWMLPETYDEHQVGNVIKKGVPNESDVCQIKLCATYISHTGTIQYARQ